MRTTTDELEREIEGRKRAAKSILPAFDSIVDALTPFVGKKFFKTTGGMLKKPEEAVTPILKLFRDAPTCHAAFFENSYGHLVLKVKHAISWGEKPGGGDDLRYYEFEITLGATDDQGRFKFDHIEQARADLEKTASESRKRVVKVQEKIRNLYDQIDKYNAMLPSYAQQKSK